MEETITDLYLSPAESPNFGIQEKPFILFLAVYKFDFKHTYKTFNNSTIFRL